MFLTLKLASQLTLLVFYVINQMTVKSRSTCFLNMHKNHYMGRIAYVKPGINFDLSFKYFLIFLNF